MSREDIELVRESFRCFNEQDWERFGSLYDTAAVVHAPEGWPETGAQGRAEIVAAFRRIREEGVASRVHHANFSCHGELVIAQYFLVVTGSATGLSEERAMSAIWRLEGGKIIETRYFWGHSAALEAVAAQE